MSEETNLVPVEGTRALLTRARHALVEARTIQDFRTVMAVAGVAADAAKRAAKLMEAQGVAAEIVQSANEAANEAAAVRIEAQAGAGRILREMAESGERASSSTAGSFGSRGGHAKAGTTPDQDDAGVAGRTWAELQKEEGIDRTAAQRWQKISDIPPEVRSAYVRQVQDGGDEVTTKGLLSFAAEPSSPKESTRNDVEIAYDDVVALIGKLIRYNPEIISGHATTTQRRTKFRKLLSDAGEWVDQARGIFGD